MDDYEARKQKAKHGKNIMVHKTIIIISSIFLWIKQKSICNPL